MVKKILYRDIKFGFFKDKIEEIYEEGGEIVGRKLDFNDFGTDRIITKRINKKHLEGMKKLLLENPKD